MDDFRRPLGQDIHSYANFQQIVVTNLNMSLRVDFVRKILFGFVDITTSIISEDATDLLLDTRALAIADVLDLEDNSSPTPLLFTLSQHHPKLGHCLKIPIPPKKRSKSQIFSVRIYYSTTSKSSGIQWLESHQTAGKKHPFLFTQCEAILARTLVPCQDTPSVKAPYQIKVSVPFPLVAACSGHQTKNSPIWEDDGHLTYEYQQPIPIPSYLIAIVVGKLVKAPLGPRTNVWTEPELLEASVKEFGPETELYVNTAEELIGFPYIWGTYDIVVLPASFPYGGMENPNLTFLSSSLITGDRSLTDVVAHEIAHSWTGNLVTNATWTDFWLNEGFKM